MSTTGTRILRSRARDARSGRARDALAAALALTVLAAAASGCFSERSRPTVPIFGDLVVLSDPVGAEISVDGRGVSATTPATLRGIESGVHTLELVYTPGPAELFAWSDTVVVPEEALDTVDAALEGGCGRNCPFLIDRGRIVCRSTGRGDTCASVFFDGVEALVWPGGGGGAYGAGGRLLLAGIVAPGAGPSAGDTMATQVYDVAWTGRAPMKRSESGRRQVMELAYWGTARYRTESLQGLAVKQTVVAVDSAVAEDMLFLRFEIENVSDDPRYRDIYPWVPEGGYTYDELYVGFGLDADVGGSDNDLGSFDPDLDLSFIYDAFFQDPALDTLADRPALVGVVAIEPPAGAARRTFTVWRRGDDWDDGDRHDFAWRLLAGRLAAGDPIGDDPDPEIGYVGTSPDDYRTIEAFGPLRLAPGDKIELTVALLLAEPVPGTYTPGTLVPPGDPRDPGRQILAVAGDLRALAAEAPALWGRYRP
jgi:hypothetical protein